jgi:hypothetical protein
VVTQPTSVCGSTQLSCRQDSLYSTFNCDCFLAHYRQKTKSAERISGLFALWVCHHIMGQYRDKGIKCPQVQVCLADANTL